MKKQDRKMLVDELDATIETFQNFRRQINKRDRSIYSTAIEALKDCYGLLGALPLDQRN